MHILLIHQNFTALNEPGGTRHHELARYIAQAGHRVTVVTSQVSYLTGTIAGHPNRLIENKEQAGVSILRAYTYPALHRSFVHRVFSFISFTVSSFLSGLQVRNVDLVWGTSPPIFQGISAWALGRLKGAPFVFEVRDLWPAFAVQVGVLRQPLLIRASEWLERFLYLHSDRVMVNSPGFIAHVQELGARQVDLVPNGADLQMFDPEASGEGFRKQHGLENKFIALYAGAHGLSNDLGVVLDAAHSLRDCPEIAFVLLGDGKDKAALKDRAAVMSLSNLHFLPPIPKTAMAQALAAADACIAILKPVPLYATVYPNKVFDYMAAGRPVVLAIDGVIREVVEKARAGIPVPPGDPTAMAEAIQSLYRQPEMRREMGLNGRRYLQMNFDRTALGAKLLDIFLKLALKQ